MGYAGGLSDRVAPTVIGKCFSMLILLSGLLAGCAAARPRENSPPWTLRLISAEEIAEARAGGVSDVYELIEQRRPRWLRLRSELARNATTVLLVYRNGSRLGGVEILRGYSLTGVTSLRYLDAGQAYLLAGSTTGGVPVAGAIVISTSVGIRFP